MSRPTELVFDRSFFIPQAYVWTRMVHLGVKKHWSQLVEARLVETLDLIDECIDRYPHMQKQFELLRMKELAFAEHDCETTLSIAMELVDHTKAWRARLNTQLIKLMASADRRLDSFDMQTRLDEELLAHHNTRVSIAIWGSIVRAEIDPLMNRYTQGRHTEDDLRNARNLVLALRGQYANIPNLVV